MLPSSYRGILFRDVSFAPFFAGAADTVQIWHWNGDYVDPKNLLEACRPFTEMTAHISLDEEAFEPLDFSDNCVWFRALKSRHCLLGYVRNREDSWYHILRDGLEPKTLDSHAINMENAGVGEGTLTVFRLWPEDGLAAGFACRRLTLKNLRYGCLFRIDYDERRVVQPSV